jgi:integrase
LAYRAHLGAFGNEKVFFLVNNRGEGSFRHGIVTPLSIIYALAGGFNLELTVHDLRHCWFTNAVRSRVYPHIADAILGHGDKKKSLRALYLTISDEDLWAAMDKMKFDTGETEIRVRK